MARNKKENQDQNAAEESLKEVSNKMSKIRPHKKRKAEKADADDDEKWNEEEDEDEMDINSFVGDVQKALSNQLQSKRKRLNNFTSECQTSHDQIDRVTQQQAEVRVRLQEEYQKQFTCIISQWDTDFNKAKQIEDKIRTLLNQQMKLISQERQVQNQRIKSLRALHERFIESLSSTEVQQSSERHTLVEKMSKNISEAQSKLLDQVAKQDLKTFRKSVATMLNEDGC